MAELAYSDDAINTLNKFYRCDVLVYVEGDDDELFWSVIFDRCANAKIKTQSLGGAPELDKLINRIVNEDLKVIAARDADFLVCCNKQKNDPRVIYTYGYSIENTLYTSGAIAKIAHLWCRGNQSPLLKESNEWIDAINVAVEKLTAYDVANYLHDCGLQVAGDNIARFAKKTAAHEIDEKKLEKHLGAIATKITDEMVDAAIAHDKKMGNKTSMWLRGHFLASAVIQFVASRIKAAGRNGKLNYESLYVQAIQQLETSLKKNGHPHYAHYRSATLGALKLVAQS